MRRRLAGFSLVDLAMTLGVTTILVAVSVPVVTNSLESMRLNGSVRDLERELQTARLKAVSTNSHLQLRVNCPASGLFRIVEVVGVSAVDSASDRCDPSVYRFPAPDADPLTRPNHDGPVRRLHPRVTVSGYDFQFAPDGTTKQVLSSALQAISGAATLTLTKGGQTKTIQVNALGKIQIQ